MAKFHINGAGEAGACRAEKGGCPFGGDENHYSSAEAARTAYEEKMSGSKAETPRYSRPNLPLRVERSVIPYGLGQVNAILGNDLKQLSGDDVFIRGNQFKIHDLMSDSYEKVNRDSDDAFAVADKLSKQFKRLAKKDPTLTDNAEFLTNSVDKAAFAYVAPHTAEKSARFKDTLRKNGVHVTESEAREFDRIFATAAKKAGAGSTPLQLARAFKKASVNESWAYTPKFDGAIIKASQEAQHFRQGKATIDYQKELDGISEVYTPTLSTKDRLDRAHKLSLDNLDRARKDLDRLNEAEIKYNEEHGAREGRAYYQTARPGSSVVRNVRGLNPANGPTLYKPSQVQMDARADAYNNVADAQIAVGKAEDNVKAGAEVRKYHTSVRNTKTGEVDNRMYKATDAESLRQQLSGSSREVTSVIDSDDLPPENLDQRPVGFWR